VPEREFITDATDCVLAERWGVQLDAMARVWVAAERFELETGGRRVSIISGFRTREEQRRLGRMGRPTAPDNLSTHRSCPATGVDISLGFNASNFMKVSWGNAAFRSGLRWGGGGDVDPDNLIPLDWRHVDLGPRR